MKSKFEEAQATSDSIQKTLAGLVTENNQLTKELEEVTTISEELASICEQRKLVIWSLYKTCNENQIKGIVIYFIPLVLKTSTN